MRKGFDQESARTALRCMERAKGASGEDRISWLRLASRYIDQARQKGAGDADETRCRVSMA